MSKKFYSLLKNKIFSMILSCLCYSVYRIKREVSSSMVEKGVNERVRLAQIYEKKTEELEKQHEEIRQNFNDLKKKVSWYIILVY